MFCLHAGDSGEMSYLMVNGALQWGGFALFSSNVSVKTKLVCLHYLLINRSSHKSMVVPLALAENQLTKKQTRKEKKMI